MKRLKEINMNMDKIKEQLDEIDKLCTEGWDSDDRTNFYSIMDIIGEIKKELDIK